jgi:hypothetical protein
VGVTELLDNDNFRAQLDTNFMGVGYISQGVLQIFRRLKSGGLYVPRLKDVGAVILVTKEYFYHSQVGFLN